MYQIHILVINITSLVPIFELTCVRLDSALSYAGLATFDISGGGLLEIV